MNARSFLHNSFAVALISSLLCSLSIQTGHASVSIAKSADEVTPLVAGDPAPRFMLETVEQEPYDFDPQKLQRPVVLVTFRGGWCPYCNLHLSELRFAIPEIKSMGVDVLFLSGDRADLLFESLHRETREDIEGLDYTILSDADATAAIALGIAFTANKRTVSWLKHKKKDYEGSSIDQHQALSVPSVFVIDASGVIRFAHSNPNYKVRLSAAELLTAVQELVSE
jgi:peroxiredoxin